MFTALAWTYHVDLNIAILHHLHILLSSKQKHRSGAMSTNQHLGAGLKYTVYMTSCIKISSSVLWCLTSKMTCIMLQWTHTQARRHTQTHTYKCRQMPLGTMSQCGKRVRGKQWRWKRERLGSSQLECPRSDTSAEGSSWTQRTERELGNQLLTSAWLLMLRLGRPGTFWITQSVLGFRRALRL